MNSRMLSLPDKYAACVLGLGAKQATQAVLNADYRYLRGH